MTTIEKIKAEIERQKEINKRLLNGQLREGCLYAYNQVRSFLGTLESENPVPNYLEEAAYNHIREVVDAAGHPGWNWETQDIKEAFIAGAKWDREQMLKEAVEGRVISNDGISFPVSNEIHRLKLMEGDKVRIIIVKED